MAAGQEKRKKEKKKGEGDEVKAGTKADSFYSILAPSCNHPVRGWFFFSFFPVPFILGTDPLILLQQLKEVGGWGRGCSRMISVLVLERKVENRISHAWQHLERERKKERDGNMKRERLIHLNVFICVNQILRLFLSFSLWGGGVVG